MNELLKALTELAHAATNYLNEKRDAGSTSAPTKSLAEDVPAKTRKPRAPKEEIGPAAAPAAGAQAAATPPPAPAGVLEPTEEESLKEVRALAKTYVQRFANQVDGIKAFRELIAATTGVARIDDLVHSQRLLVIAKAKAEIAQKDVKAKAPVETAGTAV
jgi:hypothetical protein